MAEDIYEGLDKAIDKLSRQMSKIKGKLQKRYTDNKSIRFEEIPQAEGEEAENGQLVKNKKLELLPMSVEEAILQMEMSEHDFFLFLDQETDSVCAVYKRKDGNYGTLQTTF